MKLSTITALRFCSLLQSPLLITDAGVFMQEANTQSKHEATLLQHYQG